MFTALDANSVFWQIPLAEDDCHKTVFTTHLGLYKFIRMPFGLTSALATFKRALELALAKSTWRTGLVYIDDIVIFSKVTEEHLTHVNEIFQALAQADISLKWKKCEFFHIFIRCHGHIIRPGRLEIDKTTKKSF